MSLLLQNFWISTVRYPKIFEKASFLETKKTRDAFRQYESRSLQLKVVSTLHGILKGFSFPKNLVLLGFSFPWTILFTFCDFDKDFCEIFSRNIWNCKTQNFLGLQEILNGQSCYEWERDNQQKKGNVVSFQSA